MRGNGRMPRRSSKRVGKSGKLGRGWKRLPSRPKIAALTVSTWRVNPASRPSPASAGLLFAKRLAVARPVRFGVETAVGLL
jgi:hypothetical protein